jgi:hypothetical protein
MWVSHTRAAKEPLSLVLTVELWLAAKFHLASLRAFAAYADARGD